MYWKLISLLNLAPELFSDPKNPKDNTNTDKKPNTNKSKIVFLDKLPPNINNKSFLTKSLFGVSIVILAYFMFFHGKTSHLTIDKFICNSNGTSTNILKFKDKEGYEYAIDMKNIHKNTYAEKISHNGSQVVHKVFTRTTKGNVSFNVGQLSTAGTDGKMTTTFSLDNGCNLLWTNDSTKGTACTCNNGSGTCDCCTGSTGQACTCNGNTNCSCCLFAKLANFAVHNPSNPNRMTVGSVLFSLLPSFLYLAIFFFLMRSTMKNQMGLYGKDSIFNIGKSLSQTAKSKKTFEDVAGIEEEKEELEEIVDYLKNPQKYNSMGARTPKGVILYGPPGTGKTLLAKAISGEANVPFLETSGASFDEMFVGLGAKRIRELFQKAKKLAPCIIFIDEIDALASKRGGKYSMSSGNDQTINQFLSEMDGFGDNSGIVVIAATNRLSSIDEAVLRPGRFDRHIMINLPDISERKAILKIHAKNKNISSQVDMDDVARKTPGFSGAQLENILNEATLLAVRQNKKIIGNVEISEAIDRVMAGPAKKNRKMSFSERKQIAHHEAGHAIAGVYAREGSKVEKITIIPRGQAGGYILTAPEKEANQLLTTKSQLLSRILTTLAGRAAEEIFFGIENISTGAANDLYHATAIAKNMVLRLGMSQDLGLVQHIPSEHDENPYKNNYSEHVAKIIDAEINKIMTEQYLKAKVLIEQHKTEFLLIVETLLLLETIDRKQIEFIVGNKKIPKEAEEAKQKLLNTNEPIKSE